MRKVLPPRLEAGRVRTGKYASHPSDGAYGAFFVMGPDGVELKIIASAGDEKISEGWEHVSVSTEDRVPNWEEMCFVKDLFWCSDEAVVQFHPPKADYVNQHPRCLHLWRPTRTELPQPPRILVGVKDLANPTDQEFKALKEWE